MLISFDHDLQRVCLQPTQQDERTPAVLAFENMFAIIEILNSGLPSKTIEILK